MRLNNILLYGGVLLSLISLISCNESNYFLVEVPPSHSGITFKNSIKETSELSILDYMYLYNGGGVAVGDFNNDGLEDIFFTANQDDNKLYFNQGNLQFEEVTQSAKVAGNSDWSTGVTLVDINSDGWLDIYVCAVVGVNGFKGYNELFINQQDGTFKEQAREYGLAIQNYSVSASFFDYDKDGDLDLYLLNHGLHSINNSINRNKNDNEMTSDKLFKNTDGKFVDVSKEANLNLGGIGYGLSVSVADVNNDNWDDIYVSNDFFEDDYLYINQKDGSFKNMVKSFFSNISQFSMGSDIADLNHDGYPEIITLDMLPYDETVLKSSTGNMSLNLLNRKRSLGYIDQFPRNHLQYNTGKEKFLEIAQFSGISATDWSWSALFSDLDLDGYQDLFISNGIFRRPNDADYIKYISSDQIRTKISKTRIIDNEALSKMPSGKTSNYLFGGSSTLQFVDKSAFWMDQKPKITNGVALADFDRDGDLDLVLNNFNQQATLYENTINNKQTKNYIAIQFKGMPSNSYGIGGKAFIYTPTKTHYKQLHITRGFQSSMPPVLYFGLGQEKMDSLKIIWPNNFQKTYTNIEINQFFIANYKDATEHRASPIVRNNEIEFVLIDSECNIIYEENYFPEFNREKLMPYGITEEGPGIAIGDLNGDGQDDLFIGGSKGSPSKLYFGSSKGFQKQEVPVFNEDIKYEDVDALMSDVDQDGDLDIFVVSGGGEYKDDSEQLLDRLYLNDGMGELRKSFEFLPKYYHTGSVVRSSDIDKDGDLDYFVGSRAKSGSFGSMPKSYFLKNNKDHLSILNEDITIDLGMVTDALFIDYDQDGDEDLWIVSEWSSPRMFQNNLGSFTEVTQTLLIDKPKGLWQSTIPFDVDGDGDIDLVVGNIGTNTKFKASATYPLKMYYADFDNNGQEETLLSMAKDGEYYPLDDKDKLEEQLQNFIRKRFNSYKNFAGKKTEEVFGKNNLSKAKMFEVNELKSGYFEKTPKGYKFKPLPPVFQWGPIRTLESLTLEKQPMLFLGGVKSDLPPYQGVWKSQPPIFFSSTEEYKFLSDFGIELYHKNIAGVKSFMRKGEQHLLFILHDDSSRIYKIKNYN